jgi:hypothetical protein
MHDVPRENLSKHLGFTDTKPLDNLDRQLAQHTRYLYDLQEPPEDLSSSESEPEDDAFDTEDDERSIRSRASSLASRSRYRRQNSRYSHTNDSDRTVMSILTNSYLKLSTSPQNDLSSFKRAINDFGLPHMPESRSSRRRFFRILEVPADSGGDGEYEYFDDEDEEEIELEDPPIHPNIINGKRGTDDDDT